MGYYSNYYGDLGCGVGGAVAAPADGAVAVVGEATGIPAASHLAMVDMDSIFY